MRTLIQKIIGSTALLLALFGGSLFAAAPAAHALSVPAPTVVAATDCTSIANAASSSCNCSKGTSNCGIMAYVGAFINFLAVLVGVIVVISIIIGGIQYSASDGDPSKASAAKARIRNAIIALVVFMFLYALLNFLIPGGLT